MTKKILLTSIKLLILYVLIIYINKSVHIESIIFTLKKITLIPIFLCSIIVLSQLFLTSYRWKKIGENLNSKLKYSIVLKIFWVGHFFSQFLPSSIGGDVVRIWMTSKHNISTMKSLSITLCDRFFGLFANIAIPVITYLLIKDPINEHIKNTIGLYGLLILALIISLVMYKYLLKSLLKSYSFLKKITLLIDDLELLLTQPKTTFSITMLSILIQLGHVAIIYLISLSIGAGLHFLHALLIIPTILLVSMLPISFAGWGLREAAMIVGLGFFAITKENALSISIIFGFMQIISSIPGLFFWLRNK